MPEVLLSFIIWKVNEKKVNGNLIKKALLYRVGTKVRSGF